MSSRFRGYRHVEPRQHLLAILGGFILCTLGSTGSHFHVFLFQHMFTKKYHSTCLAVILCFQTNANRSFLSSIYHRGMGFFFFNLGNKSMSHLEILEQTRCHVSIISDDIYDTYSYDITMDVCVVQMVQVFHDVKVDVKCCTIVSSMKLWACFVPVQPRSDGLILHRSISPSCGHSLGHLLLQGVLLPG